MVHRVSAETVAARFGEIRAASTASGGTALTNVLGLTSIPLGASWLSITARNFVGANVARFILSPRLTIVVTTNALGSGGVQHILPDEPTTITQHPTQVISDEMQDGDAEDFAIDSFDTAANNNYIYVGADVPFRGVAVDLNNKNDVASVLTVNYPVNKAWVDTGNGDTTDVGGDTLKQDGNVTWTVPVPWTKQSLVTMGDTTIKETWSIANLYWTRWEVSSALDTTDLVQMRALNRSTVYAELLEGQTIEFAVDPSSVSSVEALTDAGTANLIINVATTRGETFR